MDLLLQQTILSQLAYVNLTHGLRAPDTSFLRPDVVIDFHRSVATVRGK